jgi:hypothetical protein
MARIYTGLGQGGILKKLSLRYGMREKKGCPREKNLREICTENNFILYPRHTL